MFKGFMTNKCVVQTVTQFKPQRMSCQTFLGTMLMIPATNGDNYKQPLCGLSLSVVFNCWLLWSTLCFEHCLQKLCGYLWSIVGDVQLRSLFSLADASKYNTLMNTYLKNVLFDIIAANYSHIFG